MKIVSKNRLLLTKEEITTLSNASKILDTIAEKMDRAISVPWCHFEDDEIWGACEIIDDILENVKEG